ncbi:Rhs family protein [Vibrio parahaemolyticus]|nr:Rhs family protein [Vibrio parahaemolyticus]
MFTTYSLKGLGAEQQALVTEGQILLRNMALIQYLALRI